MTSSQNTSLSHDDRLVLSSSITYFRVHSTKTLVDTADTSSNTLRTASEDKELLRPDKELLRPTQHAKANETVDTLTAIDDILRVRSAILKVSKTFKDAIETAGNGTTIDKRALKTVNAIFEQEQKHTKQGGLSTDKALAQVSFLLRIAEETAQITRNFASIFEVMLSSPPGLASPDQPPTTGV